MPKDKILFFNDYQDDPFPIIGTPGAEYLQWLRGIYKVWMGKDTPDIPEVRASSVKAIVNAGRWLWICLACNSAIPVELGQPSICPQCGWQGWVDVVLPRNRKAIENELLKQPGHRSRTAIREWKPGWPMGHLQIRTKKAQAALAAGTINVSSLSVAATRLFAVSEVLTAANMNTHISNPIDDLVGRLRNDNTGGDPVEFENAIVIDSLTTTERNALTAANGMMIYNSTLNVFQRYENGAWVNHPDATSLTLSGGAQGDGVFLNSSGTVTRLAVGTDRQVFRTQGASANPIWDDLEDIRVAGTTAQGEIVFIGSNGRLNRLAAGTDRQALRTHGSGTNPSFANLEDLRIAATTAQGDVFYVGSNGRLNRLAAGTSNFFFQTKGSTADPVWASASATVVFVRLTTGTSWTVPTGVNAVYVEVIGGGGGGSASSRPGEGGLIARHFFLASSLGTTVTYAIGAGGAAASAGGNTVFAGHAVGLGGRALTVTTTFYDRVVATGQSGANGGYGAVSGGVGETGLPITVGGGAGGAQGTGSGNGGAGGAGTNSLNGLGSGGGGGGRGNSGGNGGAGGAGGIPGGGGGGGGPSATGGNPGAGGAGARGEIRIWYW